MISVSQNRSVSFGFLKSVFFLLTLQHPVSQTLSDHIILTTKNIVERLNVNCHASSSKYKIVNLQMVLQPVLHCAVLQALYQWFCFWWDFVALNDRTA